MVSLMSYVMYHTKSDIKVFDCMPVIVNSLTKLLPASFMIVLLLSYALFCSFNCTALVPRNTKGKTVQKLIFYVNGSIYHFFLQMISELYYGTP